MAIRWSYDYEDVASLKGGMTAWVAGGYPLGVVTAREAVRRCSQMRFEIGK